MSWSVLVFDYILYVLEDFTFQKHENHQLVNDDYAIKDSHNHQKISEYLKK